MERQDYLLTFFSKVVKDHRMSKAHMTVYMSLFYIWSKQQFTGFIIVYSWEVMPIAKISTNATYYMIMKQLNEYGYLKYEPSYYRKKGSIVDLRVIITDNS